MTLLALALVLLSAAIHATWNLIAKRATTSGAVFIWLFGLFEGVILTPLMLVVVLRTGELPSALDMIFIIGSAALHILYFWLLTTGYHVGDLSLVYPLARGVGPLFITVGAILLLGERPSPLAIIATLLITGGMFLLTGDPTKLRSSKARPGITFGLLTALSIAIYSLWDAYAVSRQHITPLMFIWGIGLWRMILLTPYAATHQDEVRLAWQEDRWTALAVSVMSPGAYFLILTALTFSPVSYVAPMRSVSILIGVWLGSQLLGEADTRRRLAASGAMVIGVILLGLG